MMPLSLSVPKKSESADVEECKQEREREGTNEEEPPPPISPTPVDKKQITVKSPKVLLFLIIVSLHIFLLCSATPWLVFIAVLLCILLCSNRYIFFLYCFAHFLS